LRELDELDHFLELELIDVDDGSGEHQLALFAFNLGFEGPVTEILTPVASATSAPISATTITVTIAPSKISRFAVCHRTHVTAVTLTEFTTFISTTLISTALISTALISTTFIATTFIATALIATTFIATTFIATTLIATTFIATTFIATTFIATTFIATTFIATTFIATTFIATALILARSTRLARFGLTL
jgi:hypothetical protein